MFSFVCFNEFINQSIKGVMMKNACPYCKAEHCIPASVTAQANIQGGGFYTAPCVKCGGLIDISVRFVLVMDIVGKSYKNQGGNKHE